MKRPRVVAAAAWAAALVVVAVVLPLLSYGTRDADSRLYAEIAARMSREPVAHWIAPTWPPGWYGSGYFREHPVGTFLAPAALAAVGYPAGQAAYAMNAVFQVGSLLLLVLLARRFASDVEARALLFLMPLVPLAFTYRVRANQEQLLLFLLLLALLAVDKLRTNAAWVPMFAAAAVGLVLVKGLVGLAALPVCALWLLSRRGDAPRAGDGPGGARHGGSVRSTWILRATLAFGGAALAIAGAVFLYESLYRAETGEPFLAVHLSRQMQPALARQSEALLAQKAYNLVWYVGRIVWFPFPWSLALFAAVAVGARTLWRRRRAGGAAGLEATGADLGLAFAVATALFYVLLFSLSDRRADRYIFPAYFAVAAAGALAVLRGSRRGAAFASWLARLPAWSPALLWLLLVIAHVASGRLLHLPTVKVWDPSR